MQRWCWRISTVTRSRTKFRRCRPCSPNSASPAPSSPLMPCTVKKSLELAAATDALMIAQVKDNQPTLHRRVEQACAASPPVDQHTTRDQNQHSRDETRLVEVFDPHNALADTEWAEHVGAIIRVSRTTHRRVTATGMWQTTSEIAYLSVRSCCRLRFARKPSGCRTAGSTSANFT